ncbi:MAG: glutamyl-tRNA reductase [Planctomycetota bacterium]|nr:glutamyl-tRNA reductase [Planctomycetota bacterium]
MSARAPDPSIILVGLSHRTAPVSIRERLAFTSTSLPEGLRRFRESTGHEEGVILSTCNRVEIYATLEEDGSAEPLTRFLCDFHEVPRDLIRDRFYVYRGREAVRHLFRVASSLDSQVIGESQILSQVKGAYQRAKTAGHTGKALNLLFQKALKVGKDVRTRTRIGSLGVSVASVGISFIGKIFEDLRSKVAMVIGSGEMGKVTLSHLSRQGVGRLLVVNRSLDRAEELAGRFGGEVVSYEEMIPRLFEVDIVVSSTSAPHPIIGVEDVQQAMRKRRHAPQVYLDIALPRDIAPEVQGIGDVSLYNVDDLDRVVSLNMEGCGREVAAGEEIVDEQVEAYLALQARLSLGPIIQQLQGDLHTLIRKELTRSVPGSPLFAEDDAASIDSLASRLAGKILHSPIQALRSGEEEEVRKELAELVRGLFSSNGASLPKAESEPV